MLEGRERITMKRVIKLAVMCFAFAALASGAIAGAEEPLPEPTPSESESALLAEGCFSNSICRYLGTEYNVRDKVIECSQWGVFSGFGASATNRCGNKTNWLRQNGTVIACMNPGGNRPHPGNFNEIYVAFEYGAFC